MNYGLSYREKYNLNESDLTVAQRTLHYIAENMRMEKSISEDGYNHFQQAIKALEQAICEDTISRQAVLDKAIDYGSNTYLIPVNSVKALPPVTPQLKAGQWINIDATHSKCDRCGAVFEIASENGDANYCPNCGRKMSEGSGKE